MADIMVVEDDDELRNLICGRLCQENHRVSIASNGLEATRHLRERIPDLVITDIVMPDMDGLELILEIKRKFPLMKILAVTGGGSTDPSLRVILAQTFGAQDALYKPFTLNALMQRVNALLKV